MGSGIKGVESERWDLGSQPRDQGSQAMGLGSSFFFFRDRGPGCIIFVGSGTKICHAFGTKDQKFGYKNGISDEKSYFVMTLLVVCGSDFR